MRTNRLITRREVRLLDLPDRIDVERQVTDVIGRDIQPPLIPSDWRLEDYVNRSPWRRHLFAHLGPLAGQTILDLGCGYNPTPIYFALAGAAHVTACDVSPRALESIAELAEKLRVSDRVTTCLSPAEVLPFDHESFDLIHGESVLHHLDVKAAVGELYRVLKPGGRAAFKDPLGHNWLLEFARDYLPYGWKHEIKGTDCPLKFSTIREFGRHFDQCTYRGFGGLSTIAIAACGRRNSRLLKATHRLDGHLLRCLPFLQRFCRFVVTCVEKAETAPVERTADTQHLVLSASS